MLSFTTIRSTLVVGMLATIVAARPGFQPWKPAYECGKVDVYFTGLPLNYPRGGDDGGPPFDPVAANAGLAVDKANILKAGYNLKTIFIGLEQPPNILVDNLYSNPSNVHYDVVAIGFGIRGAPLVNVTAKFEQDIAVFRERLPLAPFVFNLTPDSTLAALQRNVPIDGDCTNTPGKDYGSYIFCDPHVCTTPL